MLGAAHPRIARQQLGVQVAGGGRVTGLAVQRARPYRVFRVSGVSAPRTRA